MGYSSDCPDGVVLFLKAVLHKSGKVTDIQVVKPINCSFQEKAIKSVRKIKFTPAIKDGVAVSQYQVLQFNFHKF
jgi:TonB family protein